jgi:hypothetical protein
LLNINEQIRRILSRHGPSQITSSDNYCDVYDGAIYQKFFRDYKNEINQSKVFSLCINTDGISMCNKSKKSVWPIMLVINELPVAIRFCLENVIFAGNLFLKSLKW